MKKTVITAIIVLLCAVLFVGCMNNNIPNMETNDKDTVNSSATGILSDETTVASGSEINTPSIGGRIPCVHTSFGEYEDYDRSYHSINSTLITYVGQDRFDAWVKEKKAEQGVEKSLEKCNSPFTIYDFVKDLDFPREVFEALNDNYLRANHDYNLDVIYSSREEAEAYYASDRVQKKLEQGDVSSVKGQLKSYIDSIDNTAHEKWITRKNETEWGFSDATRSHIKITNMFGTYSYSDEFVGLYAQYGFTEYILSLIQI